MKLTEHVSFIFLSKLHLLVYNILLHRKLSHTDANLFPYLRQIKKLINRSRIFMQIHILLAVSFPKPIPVFSPSIVDTRLSHWLLSLWSLITSVDACDFNLVIKKRKIPMTPGYIDSDLFHEIYHVHSVHLYTQKPINMHVKMHAV